jgi:hypothetical protein
MTPTEVTCAQVEAIASDINDALPSDEKRADFKTRFEAIPDNDCGDLYFGLLLRMCWQTKNGRGPALAQRVYDLQATLIALSEIVPRSKRQTFK